MSIFRYIVIFSFCPCLLLANENRDIGVSYGADVMSRLVARYPQHFKIATATGKELELANEASIGKYLLTKFSTPTKVGWLQWWGREPQTQNKDAIAQCYFRKDGKGKGPEILLHKRVSDPGFPTEDFWRALIFECYNAEKGGDFMDLQDKVRRSEISRVEFSRKVMQLEYDSGLKAQEFQIKVWRPFCVENKVAFSDALWFFPNSETFEEWIEKLNLTHAGRKYLISYK